METCPTGELGTRFGNSAGLASARPLLEDAVHERRGAVDAAERAAEDDARPRRAARRDSASARSTATAREPRERVEAARARRVEVGIGVEPVRRRSRAWSEEPAHASEPSAPQGRRRWRRHGDRDARTATRSGSAPVGRARDAARAGCAKTSTVSIPPKPNAFDTRRADARRPARPRAARGRGRARGRARRGPRWARACGARRRAP